MEISLCFCGSKGLSSQVCRHGISTIFPPAFPLPSPQGIFIILHWRYPFCELYFKAAKWMCSPSKAETQRRLYKWWMISGWGSGRRQASRLSADSRRWPSDPFPQWETQCQAAHLWLSPTTTSMALGSHLSIPGFYSLLVPRPSSVLLAGGMYFLEPIWLSFLKLHLLVEHEGWPL